MVGNFKIKVLCSADENCTFSFTFNSSWFRTILSSPWCLHLVLGLKKPVVEEGFQLCRPQHVLSVPYGVRASQGLAGNIILLSLLFFSTLMAPLLRSIECFLVSCRTGPKFSQICFLFYLYFRSS